MEEVWSMEVWSMEYGGMVWSLLAAASLAPLCLEFRVPTVYIDVQSTEAERKQPLYIIIEPDTVIVAEHVFIRAR